ncbi:lutropin-choriogonadotropic hormone receptor-like isoform X2 [Bolinopsis microptera]|uniref:lutropin-choriogonadotropic hormone receptor-like isoform X2 n=1 Tax=Bolinopsis microptera TaxID=2820187 RepID=UPI00307AD471
MLLLWSLIFLVLKTTEGAPCGSKYPLHCKCDFDSHEKVRSVNCTDAGLTEFPDVDISVRTLDLSGNRITHLKQKDGGKIYKDLLSLTLNDCQTELIAEGFFDQFPSVNIVKLKGNKLTNLPNISSSSSVILDMTYNQVSRVNNFSNPTLSSLYLDFNQLTVLHQQDLNNLPDLKVLTLMYNSIEKIHEDALSPSISHLSLGSNKLTEVPELNNLKTSLLSLSIEKNRLQNFDNVLQYENLENCTMASNVIGHFPQNQPPNTRSAIRVLVLAQNSIDTICKEDFEMFPQLNYLQLSENSISYVPDHCFSDLPLLRKLDLSGNSIKNLTETSLRKTEQLETLYLQHNSLHHLVLPSRHLPNLHELDVSGNKLTEPPHCSTSLLLLYVSDNEISRLPAKHFKSAGRLKDLDLSHNKIEWIEKGLLKLMPEIDRLHLEGNKISSLEELELSENSFLTMLDLGSNGISHVPDNFFDQTALTTLILSNNKLTIFNNKTLAGLAGTLRFLDLSFNVDLEELSHVGLSAVDTLKLEGNVKLVSKLPRQGLDALRRATVPFPVMCCWFKKIKNSQKKEDKTTTGKFVSGHWKDEAPIDYKATFITAIKQPKKGGEDGTSSYITPTYITGTTDFQFYSDRLLELKSSASWSTHTAMTMTTSPLPSATTTQPPRPKRDAADLTWTPTPTYLKFGDVTVINFEELDKEGDNGTILKLAPITDELHCTPQPDEFNPCEDLIGNWVLRMGVWIVCTLAVLGNLTLFTITILSTKKFTPTRFLIMNLSFSDLFTGIYLMMLAIVDAKTYGLYEDFAMDWQNGAGCKIAGFMVTFSSELSVFTLTVISVERMVTIIHYSNPYKHLKTRHIAFAMLIGWIISATAGALPLLGFSDYSLVAFCLPSQTGDGKSLALILSLMVINTIAVTIIIYCYLTIFCNVRHLQKPLDNADFRETLRMALIILTDVLCWLPIVVCGVSAALEKPLITTSNAKILVVFFLPLNACANPFLYSLSRAGFKKDFLFVLDKMGLCKQAYYIASRRKSGMDLDLKKKLQAETKELRKPSQDSTSTTRSSSGYSSDSSYIKQLVNQFKSNIGSVEETRIWTLEKGRDVLNYKLVL